ncbi:hypothetical protein BIW11_00921 [Tropilaelaps mercedesae]|uniref:Protein kinase domain-containing protein n=1 Tax=Tropilaelaps mercedesae TaxID=418985 RepID=A0A1V9XMF0_9ACAR|nr:hypothetical protein BIW11_00921 [Tropilaelaps mercedesae]
MKVVQANMYSFSYIDAFNDFAERDALYVCKSDLAIQRLSTSIACGHFIYFMEFAINGDLNSVDVCVQEDEALFFAAQIVLALKHLHGRYTAHRDLKPHNIFVSASGYVKLGDFGLDVDMTSKSHVAHDT